MTLYPRAIVEAVCLSEGPIGSADEVALHLGLKNRFTLARLAEFARRVSGPPRPC